MSKKSATITIIILLLAAITILGVKFFSGEDSWECANGQWIKHGNPQAPKPVAGCGEEAKQETENKSGNNETSTNVEENVQATVVDNDIKVARPKMNDVISSPAEVVGEAKGGWFFEGVFPVKILDKNGKVIAESQAKALGDWMKEDPVPFKAILEFTTPVSGEAELVLSQDNPSGEGNAQEIKIPVKIEKGNNMKVKAYFGNIQFDPESANCDKVYEVERVIPKTPGVAKAALGEMLSGVTDEEKSGGFFTNINSGVEIQKLTITGGTAKVDLSSKIEEGVGGSCRVAGIRAQITETLKQFPNIKDVVISVDGRVDDALQP